MKNLLYIYIILLYNPLGAQIPDSTIVDGDTIAVELLKEVTLSPYFSNYEDHKAYYRLRRKVIKVYPYALKAKDQLMEVDEDLVYVETRRKKKKLTKLHEDWLQDQFSKELKKLTRSEGLILMKLIYRETGQTCYSLIKKYRSGWMAFIWQRLAKLYDTNLRAEFHPNTIKEDEWTEKILNDDQMRQKVFK